MTMKNAWIGNIDSPNFDFYGGQYSGNIPKRESPLLPSAYKLMETIWEMERNGEYEARQLDWGAWGAKMSKRELSDFVDSFYGVDEAKDVRRFVQGLEHDKTYVLVALETGEDYGD